MTTRCFIDALAVQGAKPLNTLSHADARNALAETPATRATVQLVSEKLAEALAEKP